MATARHAMQAATKPRIGWIGTGVMGQSMAGFIRQAGYELTVYNRTKAKAQGLLDAGAQWADSPRAVGEASDIVFSIVGYPKDVENVLIGEAGALRGMQAGGILCDMTTSSPALAERIALVAAEHGCTGMDCPVTGGDIGARKGTLSIFAGGDDAAFARVKPLLECMGKTIMHCGPAGQGQRAKLANQIAIAGVMFSTCESLLFAQEAGLNVRQWLETVVPGGAGSIAMGTLGRRVLDADYAPGFFIDHFVKDLGLCIEECRRMGLILPGLTAADQLYRTLQAQGHGKDGTQFMVKGLAELCGKQWTTPK